MVEAAINVLDAYIGDKSNPWNELFHTFAAKLFVWIVEKQPASLPGKLEILTRNTTSKKPSAKKDMLRMFKVVSCAFHHNVDFCGLISVGEKGVMAYTPNNFQGKIEFSVHENGHNVTISYFTSQKLLMTTNPEHFGKVKDQWYDTIIQDDELPKRQKRKSPSPTLCPAAASVTSTTTPFPQNIVDEEQWSPPSTPQASNFFSSPLRPTSPGQQQMIHGGLLSSLYPDGYWAKCEHTHYFFANANVWKQAQGDYFCCIGQVSDSVPLIETSDPYNISFSDDDPAVSTQTQQDVFLGFFENESTQEDLGFLVAPVSEHSVAQPLAPSAIQDTASSEVTDLSVLSAMPLTEEE
jgi:hypothetical protein